MQVVVPLRRKLKPNLSNRIFIINKSTLTLSKHNTKNASSSFSHWYRISTLQKITGKATWYQKRCLQMWSYYLPIFVLHILEWYTSFLIIWISLCSSYAYLPFFPWITAFEQIMFCLPVLTNSALSSLEHAQTLFLFIIVGLHSHYLWFLDLLSILFSHRITNTFLPHPHGVLPTFLSMPNYCGGKLCHSYTNESKNKR